MMSNDRKRFSSNDMTMATIYSWRMIFSHEESGSLYVERNTYTHRLASIALAH